MSVSTYSESPFGVADGEVRVVVSVPDLGRAASQLRRSSVFAVVVAHRAVVHHGRNVREGTLATEKKESAHKSLRTLT